MNPETTLILDGVYERTCDGQRALVFEDPSFSPEELRVLSLFTGETPLAALKALLAAEGAVLDATLPRLLGAGLVRPRDPDLRRLEALH